MSGSSHTPGPWDCENADTLPIVRATADGTFIADCNGRSGEGELDAANARLVAAAPELLDALKYCEDSGFLAVHADDSEHDRDQKAQALRAITRATQS